MNNRLLGLLMMLPLLSLMFFEIVRALVLVIAMIFLMVGAFSVMVLVFVEGFNKVFGTKSGEE